VIRVVIRLTKAGVKDADVLAQMNKLMIEDEGYEGRLSLSSLKTRMRDWIRSGDYEAVFFLDEDDSRVGYALFQRQQNTLFFSKRQVFLRHFFVVRDRRKKRIGTKAFKALRDEFWAGAGRVDLHVLIKNRRGVEFWRSLGFKEYQFGMELKISDS
jgi:GNAT superfamily N-acetyltransferase